MGVLSFWPLALLVLVPVIIVLYILKQEAKPHSFSSVMLWKEVYRNIEATKPWEKLKRNLLLFLQVLTVLLFILALMGPWIRTLGGGKQQVIMVLDNSASMDTLFTDSKTRLEAAKDAACDYVDGLGAGSVLYVISGNQQAVLELSNSTDKLEAKNRIRGIRQTSLAGNLSCSLGLVQSCASQSEEAEILFFTDTAFDMGNMKASVKSFYSDGENLSVDTVSYARRGEKLLVLVQVTNHSDGKLNREINLYGSDGSGKETLLDIGSVEVAGKDSQPVYFELDAAGLSAGIQALRAELNEKDALAGDNQAWCVLDEVKTSRVLLVTKSNLFVEKAFTNLAGIELYRTADVSLVEEAAKEQTDVTGRSGESAEALCTDGSGNGQAVENGRKNSSGYDLYIFDGMVPEKLPSAGNFLFVNCEYVDYFENCGKVQGKILKLVDSEVTSYIAGGKIGVNEARIYHTPVWGTSYVSAGEESAGFYGIYDGHKIGVLGFDLHQTDFGLQAEFPVLISGLSQYLLEGSLTERNAYVAGDSILLHGSTRGGELTLKLPDGAVRKMDASEASGAYLEVAVPGVYRVSQELERAVKEQSFTVGFPVVLESEVESADVMFWTDSDGNPGAMEVRTGAVELRNVLIVLLLLLMVGEWIVYVKLQ